MNKKHRMQKLPIAMAAALAFLAIGAVENAKARPLDIGGPHGPYYGGRYYPNHRVYTGYGYFDAYGRHPYPYRNHSGHYFR